MKRLLYIDDSKMSQQLMLRFLDGLCEVCVVSSLEEALARIHTEGFDMIIADYLYPEGDVLCFLEQIRQECDAMKLPIIVASGSMDRQMSAQALRVGANDCISKPFRKTEIRELVETMLTDPYVHISDTEEAVVLVFEWHLGDVHYQYVPEIQEVISGSSHSEVQERMQQLLQEKFEKGVRLGYLMRAHTVGHLVERKQQDQAAEGLTNH